MARLRIVVDERTQDMSDAAVECRTMNHAWVRWPQGAARRAELRKVGQTELAYRCSRCTTSKAQIIDLDTFEVVSSRMEYADDYLVSDPGTGRLPRAEARKAMVSRYGLA